MIKTSNKHKLIIIHILAFLIPLVMVQVFFALCGIYPYGGSSILTGDMNVEFVNFYAYFINIFSSKNDLSYMLAKTLGGDFPGLAAFQLHDPLLFILFLFPREKIAFGIEALYTLQVSLAGLCASLLLNRRYRTSWMSLLFSTAYAFCAYFTGYLVLTIYLTCVALLPLVLYFMLEYLDGKSGIPYVLSTVLFIYINYHMGFMLVIFLVLCFVSKVIEGEKYIKSFGRFIYAGITILLIDGFFLIRTGLSLIGQKTTKGADYGFYRNFPMNQLFANLFSGATRNEYMPLIYCSIAALFFAVIFFVSAGYTMRQKLSAFFILVCLFVSMWINAIDSVWHGFNNPEGFYYRYAYFACMVLVILGYRGYIAFESCDRKRRGYITAAAAGICLLAYIYWMRISGNAYMDPERQAVNALLVVLIALSALFICRGGRWKIAALILLCVISAGDMLYDAKVTYIKLNADDGELPEMARFTDKYQRIDEAVSSVKAQDGGFYRLEKDFERGVNDPAMFDYIGLSHDSSCERDEINHYLTNYGFRETIYYTYYNGGSTSFSDAFLGVKYLISDRDHMYKPYEEMPDAGGYRIYRDSYALPMAYIAPGSLKDFRFGDENTFEKQNKLAESWNSSDETGPVYKKAEYTCHLEGAEESEPGHFVRTEDEGYIVYDIKIKEKLPLYYYFAAPDLQSGEVYVNGDSKGWYFTENRWNVLCAGIHEPGDTVEIKMQILKDDLYITEPCFYYEDEEALASWAESTADMNSDIGEVEEITSSRLKFTVSAEKDSLVIMSIPYEKAWHIKCDGKRIEGAPAVELLMGMEIPEGDHVIEMKYVPRGTVPGVIVSVIGIMMFVWGIKNGMLRGQNGRVPVEVRPDQTYEKEAGQG